MRDIAMQIINICEHPIQGRCYLWGSSFMNYRVGKVDKTFMAFDGFTLEEVIPRIEARGFKIIPWVSEKLV
jgi:hypothetical protein